MSAVIIASVLVAFSAPAAAVYNFDGFELKTMTNGTIQGDVYVGGGHGCPSLGGGSVNPENPYNQTFDVPDEAGSNGENVTWARLFVGVWGGTETDCGWLNVTFTNNTGIATTLKNISLGFPETTCDGDLDNTPAYDSTNSSYNTGHGVWMVALNCTSNVTSGTNTVNATTIRGTIDGRVYGVVLVVVYENTSSPKVQYWVNEGNVNLHYTLSATYPELNNNVTWFNGTAYNSTEANLTVVYYTGTKNENDYMFLNAPNDASDSPGNVSNDNVGWDNSSYCEYQLDNKNVGNSTSDYCSTNYSESGCSCEGTQYETDGFDFHCYWETNDSGYTVKDVINHTGNNFAIFWRGHDDNGNGTLEGGWEASNPEAEAYVHPIVAVLRLKDVTHDYDFGSSLTGTPGTDAWAYEKQVDNSPTASNPSTVFDSTGYGKIKKDDQDRKESVTDTNGRYAAHRFNFSIDEAAADITTINVTWNGIGDHDSLTNGAKLYMYNFTAGSYRQLNSTTSGADVDLTGSISTTLGISNYISSSNVTILVNQTSADTGRKHSHIETDYVKLVVTPDP